MLGLDCYGAFQQSFYDDLNALSGGKVMAISETSNPPAVSVYATQPKWAYVMRWAMDKGTGNEDGRCPQGAPRRRWPLRQRFDLGAAQVRAEIQALARTIRG